MELKNLLNDMDVYGSRMEELLRRIEEKLKEIPYIDNLLENKGIGMVPVRAGTESTIFFDGKGCEL